MQMTEEQLRNIVRESIREQEIIEEGALDWIQGGLDVAGLIPGVGEAADGLNALLSLGRGNPLEAALSGISMIPAAGDAVGKTGKVVLKVLDPVMDMIKAGDKAADIIKKIGPEKIKKAKKAFELLKDTMVKYKPKLEAGFAAVKKADLGEVEKLLGIEIPGIAKEKAQELLQKASDNLNPEGIAKVVDFLSNMDLGGDEESKEDSEESEEKLAASYNPRGYLMVEHPTLLGHVMGDKYVNEELKDFARFLREGLE